MRVPDYESSSQIRPIGGHLPVTSGIGPGVQNLAQGVQRAAETQLALMKERENQDAQLWAANGLTDFRKKILDNFEKSKENAAPGAEDFTEGQNKYFEQSLKDALDQAPNQTARDKFELGAREFQNPFIAHSMTYEAGERQRFRLQSHADGAERESNEMYLSPNPVGAWDYLVPNRLDMVGKLSVDPATKQKVSDAIATHFSRTVVLADAKNDPAIALQRLDDGTYTKLSGWNLYGDQLDALRTHVKALVDRKDSSLLGDIRYEMKNWEASVLNGEERPFRYTKEQILSVAKGPEATELINKLNYLPKVVGVTRDLRTAPTDKLAELASSVRKDTASGKYPEAWGYDMATSVEDFANKMYKLRNDDPASAADLAIIEFDKVRETSGQPMNMHEKAALRLATQLYTLKMSPDKARVLTNDEAKGLAAEIENAPTIDEAQNRLRQLETAAPNAVGGTVRDYNGSDISRQIVSEIYSHGKLSPRFMFVNFGADTLYGNELASAARLKDDTQLRETLGAPKVKELTDAVRSNPIVQQFTQIATLQSGPQGAELSGYMHSLLDRTAMIISSKDQNRPASAVVQNLAKTLIEDQVALKQTYTIPKKDYSTGEAYDTDRVSSILDQAKKSWVGADGNKFIPNLKSQGIGMPADKVMEADPTAFAWLNTPDGSGVYLSIRKRGTAGLFGTESLGTYEPLHDAGGNLFTIKFRDADQVRNEIIRHEGLKRNYSREQRGTIRSQ